MSRLLSMFLLWLLLLLAAAPASAVMDVQPRNCTWEMPASSYDLAPDVRDGPNLYAYVKQNPWSKFDPNGLWSWSAFGKGLAWGAGAAAAIALAPVLLPAMAATAVTAAIVTVGVASTAVVGTELATNRHVEVGWSGVGLSESTLTADERDERVSGLVGGLVGGGLTGRFAGPKLRCLGNPKSNDQALVDSLVSERSSRVAEGSETGQATFSVAQSRGQTTAITESAKGVNGTHAEVQSSALARSGNAPMTVAVDQIPCPNCTRDVVAGLPAGSRVVVPANAPNSTGSPKTAARDGANEGMPVVPRTLIEKPYTQKLTPPPSRNDDD